MKLYYGLKITKGKCCQFFKLRTVSEAKELINFANKEYKKSGLKPRS